MITGIHITFDSVEVTMLLVIDNNNKYNQKFIRNSPRAVKCVSSPPTETWHN